MNEQQVSDIRIEQSNAVLDALEGKCDIMDAVKETKYWRPDGSDKLIERIALLRKPKEVKDVKKPKK